MTYELALDPQFTQVADNVFVANNAVVIGNVHIGSESSIWFGVVIRGDWERVRIGEQTNIQDGCIVHSDPGFPCVIGNGVTVGHRAVVHSARVGDNVLIGMGATLMNGAVIGNDCIIGAGALVTEGKQIPPRSLVLGMPAKAIRELTDDEVAGIRLSAAHYVYNGQAYKAAGYGGTERRA